MNKRVISLVEVYTWFMPNDLSEFEQIKICVARSELANLQKESRELSGGRNRIAGCRASGVFKVMSAFSLTLNSLLPSQSLFSEVQLIHSTGFLRDDSVSEGSHSTVS